MARTFKQLWRSTNGLKIRNQSDHMVVFVFDNLKDIDRILQNQPSSFDKHLVMLQRYNSDSLVQDLDFTKTLFWVQVHDIPIRYLTKEVAENICETIGEVHKSAGAVTEEDGHFIRVRVVVDITLSLCTLESGAKSWVHFKYERLPSLYLIEDLTSPAITNNSVEVSRVESETIKEKELSPKAGNKENLFDIQIKEIDTKLAKFDEGPNSMGCTLKSFKANNNSIPK